MSFKVETIASPLGIRRLKRLANFLRTKVPPESFRFNRVLESPSAKSLELPTIAENFGTPKCGAVGCAIGWAPMCFPSLIRWEFADGESPRDQIHYFSVRKDHHAKPTPRLRFHEAAACLFEMPVDQARSLFSPEPFTDEIDMTPSDVADRIENYVNNGILPRRPSVYI